MNAPNLGGLPVLGRMAPVISEPMLLDAVIDLGHVLGWRAAHFRPARTETGWRTPVSADGKGFVDLVLVKNRVIFAELKSARGKQSHDQKQWMIALRAAGAEYCLWTPADWLNGDIEKALR